MSENPAPGNYSPKLKHGGGFKFSTDVKSKPIRNNTPGPGAYRVPTSIAETPERYISSSTGKFNQDFKFV